MRVERNVRLLEAHALCSGMLFVIAVIMPYYRDEIGLSFKDFLLGEAAFAATLVLLDVPCGWLSDVWQRKHVLALGSFLELVGYAVLMVADGLPMAVLAQCVIGVGICLLNGTNTAILYESLLVKGREGEYRRREGRRAGMGLYSIAAASVASGFLYNLHHQLPIALSLMMHLAALAIACALDEPERHRKRPEKHPVADIAETTRYALRHPVVGMIIVFAAVMFCSTKLIMWSQQPYYMAMGLHEGWFGLMMAAGFTLGGFSSHMAHRFDGKVSSLKALSVVWAVAVLVCLGAGVSLGWHGVLLLMIGGTCLYGIAAPRVSEAVNHHVGSDRRATVLSTQSLLVSLMFIPVSWGLGHVSERWGVQAVLVAIALWLGVAGICLAVWAVRKNRKGRRAAARGGSVTVET